MGLASDSNSDILRFCLKAIKAQDLDDLKLLKIIIFRQKARSKTCSFVSFSRPHAGFDEVKPRRLGKTNRQFPFFFLLEVSSHSFLIVVGKVCFQMMIVSSTRLELDSLVLEIQMCAKRLKFENLCQLDLWKTCRLKKILILKQVLRDFFEVCLTFFYSVTEWNN